MYQLFQDFLKITYDKNILSENKAKEVLIKNDFKEIKYKLSVQERKELIKGNLLPTLTSNSKNFIYQPCGTQSPPDFLISNSIKSIFLECKGSRDTVKWNTSLPKQNYIYLFTNPRGTTFALGKDIFPNDLYQHYEEMQKELNQVKQKYVKIIQEKDTSKFGWNYYIRNMYIQKGSNKILNFNNNSNKKSLEEAVLEYIK